MWGYMSSSEKLSGYDSRRTAFIGAYGDEQRPNALESTLGCTNSDCFIEKLCLALQNDVKDALLGVENSIREMLDKVIIFEKNSEWEHEDNLNSDVVMEHYLAALAWVLESGYN